MDTRYIDIHIPVPTGTTLNLLIGFAAYVVSLFLICKALRAFRLQNAAEKVMFTYGIPFLVVWWVFSRPIAGWNALQRNRRREIFNEIFARYPIETGDYTALKIDQPYIDSVLTTLAENLQSAFNHQEVARKRGDMSMRINANSWVTRSKSAFWQAHGLASRYGYTVKDSYKQYLLANQAASTRSSSRRTLQEFDI